MDCVITVAFLYVLCISVYACTRLTLMFEQRCTRSRDADSNVHDLYTFLAASYKDCIEPRARVNRVKDGDFPQNSSSVSWGNERRDPFMVFYYKI
jgi:hypothetical protein